MAILSTPLQFIASVPIFTRVFTVATVCLTVLYRWLCITAQHDGLKPSTPFLTLIPGSSLFYPWTFATSALVETSYIELAVSLLVVPASLRYLERLWGSVELLKFLLFTVVISNIIAVAFNWIEFIATKNAELFLYDMQYHGQMSIQTAILVAFTQLIPEHQVQVMGVIKARVKTLPMAYLTFSTVMCLVGYQNPYILIQFAWLVSWVYLRFYKKNSEQTVDGGSTYGDRSETFAFVQWFPPFIHRPISILSNYAFAIASRFRLIPTSGHDDSGAYSTLPGPSGTRAEAERRRAMALKALDQRLAAPPGPQASKDATTAQAIPPGSSDEPSATKVQSDA